MRFVDFDIKHTLGFVANPRRFNVAMTRAQALLIVIGDPVVLSLDPMWREFLNFVHDGGGWRGAPRDWDAEDEASERERDFIAERRADLRRGLDAMDDLARRLQSTVIDDLDNADRGSDQSEIDAAQDKPWRERE
jgi:helicase MOV-10